MKISLKAPAKINWFLSVLDIPAEANLVHKAAALLKKAAFHKSGAKIELKKNIPVAAGLGGGSSDAAYTLIGLNRLWGLNLDKSVLLRLAAELGSDVPFFLSGPLALVEGRGEKVTELYAEGSMVLLLVKPDIAVSTSWAYNLFETRLTKKPVDIKLFCQALVSRNFAFLRDTVFNDLEDVVIRRFPLIGGIKRRLAQDGALLSLMSGSGSTVFGVFNTEEEAARASKNMPGQWCRVVRTLGSSDELGM